MGRHVFISYSRHDQAYTRELVEDLRQRGFEAWVDDRIDYGEEWWRTIVEAIRSCAAFVVVMTPDSEESDWVEREVQLALRERKAIFPLLLSGREFPLLITTQYVNVTDGRMPPRDFYQRLAQAISVVQQRELAEMYGQAQVALGQKRYDEAEHLLTQIVDRDASYKDASSLLIEVSEQKYRGALQADPQDLKARVGLASLLLRRGDLSQAAEEYEKALEIDPQDHAAKSGFCQTHLALGDELRDESRIEEAVEYYRRILSVNAEHQAARERVAAYHVQQAAQWKEEQKLDEALEALERALELSPEDESIAARLAEARAARQAKSSATLRDNGEDHLAAERWEQAIACLEEYLSSAPEDDKMAQAVEAKLVQAKEQKRLAELYSQAEAALSHKRYTQAARLLREVLKLEGGYKDAPRLLAQALEWQRQIKPRWKEVRVLGGAGGFLVVIIFLLLIRLPSAFGPGAVVPESTHTYRATPFRPTPTPAVVAITPLQTLEGHGEAVRSVAFSPDGSILASGSLDKSVQLWQVSDGALLQKLTGEGQGPVESVAFSPDGQMLASGARDGAVRLWRVSDGTVSKTLTGHTVVVNSVAFSPDGAILASGSNDGTVILWDVQSDELLRTLETPAEVEAVALSPAGKILASGGGRPGVMLWDMESGETLSTLGGHISTISKLSLSIPSLAFSPDGVILASGCSDSTVVLWDVGSGQWLQTLTGHTQEVHSVAFSPDGLLLASGSLDKTVMVWDTEGGQPVCVLEGHNGGVHSVAFSPDGRTLASGSEDRTVRLWDTTPCLAATGAGGRAIVVTSAADGGTGTLRQALLDAQPHDTVTFDPTIFPPSAPVTISLASGLPDITQGYLTIDASNAGVIVDGTNIGTTPETMLLDDISLTLDGGPNLIANGDFSAGLGHWRLYPFRWTTLTTGTLESGDFTSPPHSLAWSGVARQDGLPTAYDTGDSSEPWLEDPYETDSTAWIAASGGSTVELRLQYKGSRLDAGLIALYQDGHTEEIATAHLERRGTWGEGMLTQVLPADTVAVALELRFSHLEGGTPGLGMNSPGNTIRGLQITNFPQAGIAFWSAARSNIVGGDRSVGAGPLWARATCSAATSGV
jgi:WD40 repeat protein/tetratricopeptide (TPR) repeat protein